MFDVTICNNKYNIINPKGQGEDFDFNFLTYCFLAVFEFLHGFFLDES